jgi:hypothetical protein
MTQDRSTRFSDLYVGESIQVAMSGHATYDESTAFCDNDTTVFGLDDDSREQ